MTRLRWTLFALATLGSGAAHADHDARPLQVAERVNEEAVMIDGSRSSYRGVSQDDLVLPSGGEITGQMRFLTSEPFLGGPTDTKALAFSDLALFGLHARYSVFSKLELSAHVELLPKQPSYTDEKPWQSVGFGAHSPLGTTAALAVSGAGGHLLGSDGSWISESIAVEFRKPIHEILTFDVQGGVDSVALLRDDHDGGWITELGVQGSALFREPHGNVGAWVGMTYAIPVASRGFDPTTNIALDPQARLDFRIGAVISIVPQWDLFAEYAVVDRGDLANPATRLPILDGGFDQHQLMFGVTRHVAGKRKSSDDDGSDGMSLARR